MKRLSHYDSAGSPRMVDISAKAETKRTARAQAFVRIAPRVLKELPRVAALHAAVARRGAFEQL